MSTADTEQELVEHNEKVKIEQEAVSQRIADQSATNNELEDI